MACTSTGPTAGSATIHGVLQLFAEETGRGPPPSCWYSCWRPDHRDARRYRRTVFRLRNARTIVVLTGSGVSAASGILTFRGDDGLWRTFRAEELATPEAFAHDPKNGLGVVRLAAHHHRLESAERNPYGPGQMEPTALDSPRSTRTSTASTSRAGTANVIRFHGSIWSCAAPRNAAPPSGEDHTAPKTYSCPPPAPRGSSHVRAWSGSERTSTRTYSNAHRPALPAPMSTSPSAPSPLVFLAAGLLNYAKLNGAFTVEINPGANRRVADRRPPDRCSGGGRARDARRPRADGMSGSPSEGNPRVSRPCPHGARMRERFTRSSAASPPAADTSPSLSPYDTSHGSSLWKNSTCAIPRSRRSSPAAAWC